MGEKWSKLVKEQAFNSLGTGKAKIIYNNIESENRFALVKDAIKKNPEIEMELDNVDLEWPADSKCIE